LNARQRTKAAALLLATLVLSGPAYTASAQSQAPDSTFIIPSAGDLEGDATRAVQDQPVPAPDEVDLSDVIQGATSDMDALSPGAWDLETLAKSVSDPEAAFALVRDRIGFDAYAGMLRGPAGTLSARAGNAFDRATLLKELVDVQGRISRFAFGALDPETAAAVVARSFETPTSPLEAATRSPFDAAFEAAVDTRARRDHALLTTALGDHIANLDADASALAVSDVTRHAWIQVQQDDGTWLDLDPTLPDAQPGQALTAADATSDQIAEADLHTVHVVVTSEMLVGSELNEQQLIEVTLPAWSAADQQILLSFTPETGSGPLGGPGGLLGGGGGSSSTFVPILIIDDAAWPGSSVFVTGELGGGGLLGPGTPADLVSLSLTVATQGPGQEVVSNRHVIADRLAPDIRAGGAITPDDLAAVADVDGTPAIFQTVVNLLVSTGGSDPRVFATDRAWAAEMTAFTANTADVGNMPLDQAFAPAAIADESLVVASEQRFLPAIDSAEDIRAYVATPRVYLASRSLDTVESEQLVVATDLLRDVIRILPRDGAAADTVAMYQVWYGALQAAFETEYALSNSTSFEAQGMRLQGVSFDMAKALTVVSSSGPEIPAADERLTAILSSGGLAVVPGDPATASTWWEIASDGSTRSIVAPSIGAGIGSGKLPSVPRGVTPVPKAPPGGRHNRGNKGGGTEYPNTLKPSEAASPAVQKVARKAAEDTFEQTAGALAKWKKFSGG
jgi:hypothetical protein